MTPLERAFDFMWEWAKDLLAEIDRLKAEAARLRAEVARLGGTP